MTHHGECAKAADLAALKGGTANFTLRDFYVGDSRWEPTQSCVSQHVPVKELRRSGRWQTSLALAQLGEGGRALMAQNQGQNQLQLSRMPVAFRARHQRQNPFLGPLSLRGDAHFIGKSLLIVFPFFV